MAATKANDSYLEPRCRGARRGILLLDPRSTGAAEESAPSRLDETTSPSALLKLTPILDEHRILRVGSRLKHAILSFDERHPVILPTLSHLTNLVIDACHRRTLHRGVQSTLAAVRQRYWIPGICTIVKQHIHRCVMCVRWRTASPQQLMGNLPETRVTPSRVFQHTGVDYTGPILLRSSKGQDHRAYKAFVAIFICCSIRPVYIEVVLDYTAEAFLAAFKRFNSARPVRDPAERLRHEFRGSGSPTATTLHRSLRGEPSHSSRLRQRQGPMGI